MSTVLRAACPMGMRRALRAVGWFAASVSMAPGAVSANGGPVAYTEAAAEGGVFPVENADVALRSEHLGIVLDPDGVHYSVKARYDLSNPGRAVQVTYGVPMYWNDPPRDDQEWSALMDENRPPEPGKPKPAPAPRRVNAKAQAAAAQVRIDVGGRKYTCSPVAWTPGSRRPLEPPVALPFYTEAIEVRGWCIARIEVPAGDSVPLTLTYRAELRYEDDEDGESALPRFGPRQLEYALFPAGFWKGKADLSIDLELGHFAPYATVTAPAGGRRRGTTHVWKLAGVDLRKLPAVEVTIESQPFLAARELATWNAKEHGIHVELSAAASSELPAQGAAHYSARLVTDGNPATAWCEGVAGDGVGQWIELKLPRTNECYLQGFAVVPGYAKSAKAYRSNGRVSRARIAECGTGGPAAEHELELSDDPLLAAVLLPMMQESSTWKSGTYCVRLTILQVAPGTRYHDTCISELAPVFDCP